MTDKPAVKGNTRAEAKRCHLLDTAWEVFSEMGYANASMALVVARAGGSKATLYGHFRSKEELLKAVLEQRAQEMKEKVFKDFAIADDVIASLLNFGTNYLNIIINSDLIEVYRLTAVELRRIDQRNDLYYRDFVDNWQHVAQYLEAHILPEHLLSGGAWGAAMHLRGLLEGDLSMRRLTGVVVKAEPQELEKAVAISIQAFLRIYAPECAEGCIKGQESASQG